jgi:enterochelin esterase family protein
MADAGSLLSWATWHCAAARPIRVALLDAAIGYRDQWYAADTAYLDHLASAVLPALAERAAVSATVGLGASLGALSLLCLHRRHPRSLDALAIQSGSFLAADLDPQESDYAYFDQVCGAVTRLSEAGTSERLIPLLLTCGAIEENLANNRRMAAALLRQGYPVDVRILPDAHTMIGWRDAWSPGLARLLAAV